VAPERRQRRCRAWTTRKTVENGAEPAGPEVVACCTLASESTQFAGKPQTVSAWSTAEFVGFEQMHRSISKARFREHLFWSRAGWRALADGRIGPRNCLRLRSGQTFLRIPTMVELASF
jgi:hypothetical protein